MHARRFDWLTRELSAGTSRRHVLRGLAAGAAGLAGGALGRTPAAAAPNTCNAAGSLFFPPGPGRAAFQQVCKKCDADFSRICETSPASFICCPEGEPCLVDCQTGTTQCGGCPESTVCPGSCAGTCCPEP
jgi:hypothetical protein